MPRALIKTVNRSRDFIWQALIWRDPYKEYVVVGWCLIGGAVWLALGLVKDPHWLAGACWGAYLFGLLIAVCAIDARFGIIPDPLVFWLAAGGIAQLMGLDWQISGQYFLASALVFSGTSLLRLAYRRLRGHDGLGFGDVKFLAAGALWIGLEGLPSLLTIAIASAVASLIILRTNGERLSRTHSISFGPHLAAALWIVWSFGPSQFFAR